MTTLYAAALVVGGLGVVLWVVLTVLASRDSSDPDTSASDAVSPSDSAAGPEVRWGASARVIIAGLFGFGMAGISASYAGWSDSLALAMAVVGGAGLGGVAYWLGPGRSA